MKASHFNGADYKHERDYRRLKNQSDRIFLFMSDGNWKTLGQISEATGAPQASASAALRDFRKDRFGAHIVNRRYIHNGLYEYQLILNVKAAA